MLLRALILLLLVTGALAWWASAQWDSAPSYARETAAPSDAGRAAAERAEVPQRVGEHVRVATETTPPANATGQLQQSEVGLRVLVLDALDAPVAGADVELHALRTLPARQLLKTDERGVAVVRVDMDDAFVRASHPDVGRSVMVAVPEGHDRLAPLRLYLLRPVTVRGIALDNDAKPIAGGAVTLAANTDRAGLHESVLSTDAVVTRADGTFEFEAAAGASVKATVVVGDDEATGTCQASADERLVIAMANTFGVWVATRMPGGEYVNADVWVHVTNGAPLIEMYFAPDHGLQFEALRPKEGHASFHRLLGIGKHMLCVRNGGYETNVPIEASLSTPRPRVEVQLRDKRDSSELPGWPTAADPSPWIVFDVVCSSGEAARRPSFWWQMKNGGVSPAGSQPADGAHQLYVGKLAEPRTLFVSDSVTGEAGFYEFAPGLPPPRVHVVLRPGGGVRVHVLHRGRPARGLRVEVTSAQFRQPLSIDGDGAATFEAVPVGPANVAVFRGPEQLDARQVHVLSEQVLDETFVVDLSR